MVNCSLRNHNLPRLGQIMVSSLRGGVNVQTFKFVLFTPVAIAPPCKICGGLLRPHYVRTRNDMFFVIAREKRPKQSAAPLLACDSLTLPARSLAKLVPRLLELVSPSGEEQSYSSPMGEVARSADGEQFV